MDRSDRMHHGAAGGPPYSRGAPPPAVRSAPEQGRGTGGYGGPPPGATAPHGSRPGTGTGRPGASGGSGGSGGRSRSKRGLGLAAATVLLVGIAGGAWWALTAPEASATQVSLETVSSSGSLPFGAPAANDAVGVLAPDNASGQLAGNTSGLYARPAGAPPCDSAAIVSGITGDPAKAAAWAAPLGIGAGDIGGFVGGLSPLTLRADTAVTQYGYAEGQFQPYPAVLQAGTAVLVNSFGQPTVKCYNANPLGPPTASNSDGELAGAPWPGFSLEQTVTVVAASASQSRLVVVDGGSNRQEPAEVPPQTVPPKPTPTPPTNGSGQLLLTGVHNYDGTVTLSDGRIIRQDQSIVSPQATVIHPPNSTRLPDGGIQEPNGRIFNQNGLERLPIKIGLQTINPDNTVTPPLQNQVLKRNYDGSFMIVSPGTPGGVTVFDRQGTIIPAKPPIPAGSTVDGNGTVTTPGGKVLSPLGVERPPKVNLPGGAVLDPKDGNTPPADQQATDQQDAATGAKVVLGTGPGGGGVVEKGKDGQLVPVQQQPKVVCNQAPCEPVPGQGTPGGPVVAPPLDENGNPVVTAPGDTGGTGTTAPDCATAPAGTSGCAKVPEKAVEPAPGTEPGTAGTTGGTTTGGEGSGGTGGSGGEGSSSTGSSGTGGGSSGGESGSGGN